MVALYIIAALAVLINILLIIPVTLSAETGEKSNITVKYLFFTIRPGKGSKKKKKKQTKGQKTKKKSASEGKSQKKKKKKKQKISAIINEYKEIATKLLTLGIKLLKRIVIKQLNVNITVCEEDAAETAVEYGLVCGVLYPALSITENIFTLKEKNIELKADYNGTGSAMDITVKAYLRPMFALTTLVGAAVAYFKFIKNK